LVWEPVNNFSIGLDWWKIEHEGIIDQPTTSYQLNNPDLFPGSIHRFPVTARDIAVGAPGQLRGSASDEAVGLDRLYFNIAQQTAEGIDFEFRHKGDLGEWGRLTSSLAGTYNISYERAVAPGQPLIEYNGTYNYPRWRGNVGFEWDRGPWNSSLFVFYIHSYYQANQVLYTHVDSWTTVDWQIQYRGFKNWTLAFGIKNLFDEDPPFSDDETQGYDFTTHNPVGRYYYGRVKYSF
jgi:iron complex outermembrane receptor protein